ncbi:MAG: peptide chain release factor N(5)-glutamine methyltransferase [bacterium]
MTNYSINKLIKNTVSLLERDGISHEEAVCEVYILLEHFAKITKKDLILNPNMILNEDVYTEIQKAVKLRIEEKLPVQYITGEAYFMGECFKVNKNVLIPRPETEILVNETIKTVNLFDTPFIVDIGTGSGCIAIMIAKLLSDINIFSIDISEESLNMARENASKLGVLNNLTFLNSDLLQNIDKNIDIIVSNPPYIDIKELKTMQSEVALHEPHLALFADENGLFFYRNIIEQAVEKLNKNGFILFELGIDQSQSVKELFIKNNFTVMAIIPDFAGIDRVIIARKNK